MKKLKIAIDGPASSGKSTIAKKLAEQLGYIYLDTGAMYRCMTLSLLDNGIDLSNEQNVVAWIKQQKIAFITNADKQRILLNGIDVTESIRMPHVSQQASFVSAYPKLREELVKQQQAYIKQGGIIMDGRDIGTVVMPDAELKIYMIASSSERAKRRYLEQVARGITEETVENIQRQIEERDTFDTTRTASPLKKADDAIELDTTHLSIDEVIERILLQVKEKELADS